MGLWVLQGADETMRSILDMPIPPLSIETYLGTGLVGIVNRLVKNVFEGILTQFQGVILLLREGDRRSWSVIRGRFFS